MIVFWGSIIGLGAWLIAGLMRRSNSQLGAIGKNDPLAIVKERYAKGEITKEQFEQIKRDLL